VLPASQFFWERKTCKSDRYAPGAGTSDEDIDAAVKAVNTEKVLQDYCRHIRHGGEFRELLNLCHPLSQCANLIPSTVPALCFGVTSVSWLTNRPA
jgi:hypothetical protein